MVWLWQQEPIVLLALLLVVTGTWAFIELAEEVLEGETQPLDVWVVQGLRNPQDLALPLGPQWLAEVGRDVTALGSNTVLILIVAAVAGFLHLQGQQKTMWLVLLAVCSGAMLSHFLKLGFARPRPDFVPHAATMTQSFPSGHSMLSAVVYLSLGALLAQREHIRRIKVYFLGVALCLTFLVGMSRVYLGVHYPTDVLAGWTVGLVWAMVWWLIAWYMRR
jgi:undecaprenyl-diphosphatase